MGNNNKALEQDVIKTTVTNITENKNASNNMLARLNEKKVPFLPDGWQKDINKYLAESKESKYKIKSFEKILRMTQEDLKEYCANALRSAGYKRLNSAKGFLYAKGERPILLVAHLDTAHKELPKDIIYKDNYMTSPQGIGGDDRCGVYIILQLIQKYKCHVLFTEDEEVGCIGAGLFAENRIARKLAGKLNFIIEFDRRGEKDAVYYSCDNKEFKKFINDNSQFETEWGSYSDICEVAPVLKAAAVNLSSGYYQEHTKAEYIDVKAMINTIAEASKLLEKSAEMEQKFEYIEEIRPRHLYGWGWDDEDDFYGYRYGRGYDYGHYGSGYYDDDESYVSAKKIPEAELYHIYFSVDDLQFVREIEARSKMEAVGIFLMEHDELSYNDIEYIFNGERWCDDQ